MKKNNTIHNGCFGITAYRDGGLIKKDGFFTVWLCVVNK